MSVSEKASLEDSKHSRPGRLPLVIGLAIALVGGVAVAAWAIWGSTGQDANSAVTVPTPPVVAADSCSAEGFDSLLLGQQSDHVVSNGAPRCEGTYAVIPLLRNDGATSEDLLAAFNVGTDNAWQHIATVQPEDCPELADIESGFPTALCSADSP